PPTSLHVHPPSIIPSPLRARQSESVTIWKKNVTNLEKYSRSRALFQISRRAHRSHRVWRMLAARMIGDKTVNIVNVTAPQIPWQCREFIAKEDFRPARNGFPVT